MHKALREVLGAHVTPYDPRTQAYLNGVQSTMVAHGADPHGALQSAYGAIWGLVQRQASMLSFVDTFRFMAVVFIMMLPLLFVMQKPRHHGGAAGMH